MFGRIDQPEALTRREARGQGLALRRGNLAGDLTASWADALILARFRSRLTRPEGRGLGAHVAHPIFHEVRVDLKKTWSGNRERLLTPIT
jgi:hypothetical protein